MPQCQAIKRRKSPPCVVHALQTRREQGPAVPGRTPCSGSITTRPICEARLRRSEGMRAAGAALRLAAWQFWKEARLRLAGVVLWNFGAAGRGARRPSTRMLAKQKEGGVGGHRQSLGPACGVSRQAASRCARPTADGRRPKSRRGASDARRQTHRCQIWSSF
jgi:hypothetical protein